MFQKCNVALVFFCDRHRVRKHANHSSRERSRPRHHHYSDDGYTSDPGLLRDVIIQEEVSAFKAQATESYTYMCTCTYN